MTDKKVTGYLVANSPIQCRTTAIIDFGWVCTNRTKPLFLNHEGECVQGVCLLEQLDGVDKGCKLYLGHGWRQVIPDRDDWLKLEKHFAVVGDEKHATHL